jgi:hypothetical protein
MSYSMPFDASFNMPSTNTKVVVEDSAELTGGWYWFWYTVVFFWVFLGILGFLWSIICFGRSGDLGYKIVGLLLAIFFGPIYFVYFLAVKNYCR